MPYVLAAGASGGAIIKKIIKNAGCSLIMLNLKENFSYVLKSYDLILSREIYSVKVKNNPLKNKKM
jgi:hypothetical protein